VRRENTNVASTLGGDDPAHDYASAEKDALEDKLYKEARDFFTQGRAKERKRKIAQAREVSREKSSAAQHH
jgi:hypothetical protein